MAWNRPRGVVVSIFALAGAAASGAAWGQSIRYVNAAAPAGGDGMSWPTAFRYLQDGLAAASSSAGSVTQIWVAAGRYTPDLGAGNVAGDRNASFQLLSQVTVYGGFAGNENSLTQRQIAANVTRLSGDLSGNDGADFANYGENSYHVVSATSVSASVLDGVEVSGGSALASPAASEIDRGGGLYLRSSDVTAVNCRIVRNRTANANLDGTGGRSGGPGGGVYAQSCTLVFQRCEINGNQAGNGWSGGVGGQGGGLFLQSSSSSFDDCALEGNRAGDGGSFFGHGMGGQGGSGGAVAVSGGSATFLRCTFTGNRSGSGGGADGQGTAAGTGGAIHAASASLTVRRAKFLGNSTGSGGGAVEQFGAAGGHGGGLYASGGSTWISESVFSGNRTGDGGNCRDGSGAEGGHGGGLSCSGNVLTIVNTAFSGNVTGKGGDAKSAGPGGGGAGLWVGTTGAAQISNCTVVWNRGGAGGNGIGAVPNFGGPGGAGGGLFLGGGATTIPNCVFHGNQGGAGGSGATAPGPPGGGASIFSSVSANVSHCDVEAALTGGIVGGTWGVGNTQLDPQFVDADGADNVIGTADDNLRLRASSPCIDAGANVNVPTGVVTDLSGMRRFVQAAGTPDCPYAPGTCGIAPIVDMGAYEYSDPLTLNPGVLEATPSPD